MNIKKLKQNWDALGEEDPYWAVLTEPSKINKKWKKEAFYLSGQQELSQLFSNTIYD